MRTFKFLYILLCVGFTLGTLTLNLVVENITSPIRESIWFASYENFIVIAIILIYLYVAVYLTRVLFILFRKSSRLIEIIGYVLLTTALIASFVSWMLPSMDSRNSGVLETADGRFTTGPYPDREKMLALKKQGYTIISLLSPYVAPFEPILINKETKLAQEVGIEVIQAPMLPWISGNEQSANLIKNLAQTKNDKKYYIHCYFGRDRAFLAMKIIDHYSPVTAFKSQVTESSNKNEIKVFQFERDVAIDVGKKVVFTPNPTPEEFMYLINNRRSKKLNAFFDTTLKTAYSIQSRNYTLFPEEKNLAALGVNLKLIYWNDFPYDPNKILAFARELKQSPDSAVVYTFYTSQMTKPLVLDGIFVSYVTDLPALPRVLIAQAHMGNGIPTLIAPNVLMGPKPTSGEIKRFLVDIGVRKIAYIGDCDDDKKQIDNYSALKKSFEVTCYEENDEILIPALSKDGPWYVYGPELPQVEDKLKKAFANSFPNIDTSPKNLL